MADMWAQRQRESAKEHWLDDPGTLLHHLHEMRVAGSRAHEAASQDHGLTGSVRDLIFGLNTTVDALIDIIKGLTP